MFLHLRGWPAKVFLVCAAIVGILTALATVLDFVDAYWMYVLPATLVYAVVLWVFATPRADPSDHIAEVILAKLFVTLAWVAATFVAIAAVIFLCTLVADNWPYVVLAAIIVMGIMLWAMISVAIDDRKTRRHKVQLGREDAPPLDPPRRQAR